MAISIDTIYQRVLAIANKEQRGYITPQEFNLLANQAQMKIFESYFYDLNKRERLEPNRDHHTAESDLAELMDKKLAPFTSIATVTSAHTFPSNYQTGRIFYNDRVCRKVDLNEIQNIISSVRHNSTHSSYAEPLYAKTYTNGQDIKVFVGSTGYISSGVTCEVFTKPASVAWGYVVVNDKALYNSNTSTNFTLHDSEEDTLVMEILQLAGVVINKPELIQVAAQQLAMDKQQQNT